MGTVAPHTHLPSTGIFKKKKERKKKTFYDLAHTGVVYLTFKKKIA